MKAKTAVLSLAAAFQLPAEPGMAKVQDQDEQQGIAKKLKSA